ncbi:MAG: hypothetical protein Q8S73_45055, partial [Deltaproteobacteria bacterium]|nr:hypothetical protein [Deltaproteobacteria bacterium]
MRARSVGWKVACLAVWVSGCGLGTSVVGGAADAGPDVGLDVASDLGAMDAPAADAPFMCRNNSECVGNAGGPVCAVGRCVACSATDDRCPAGQRCDTTTFSCVPGCRNDDACASATVDGGVGVSAPRCDPTTRACVACVVDDHCTLGQRCMGNQCVPGCDAARGCVAGQTCCGGGCVDIRTNTGNCGGCGMTCAVNNATPACLVGACSVGSCAPGFGDCDSAPANGCEVDTRVTLAHCGACNNACPARANATPTCAAGACGFLCDAGFADCDGDPSNGCESDTRTSTAHCGACGTACATRANAATTCVAGACGSTCDAGFADCDGDPSNGCEVDTRTSTAHCGACNAACVRANAAPTCAAGVCGLGACASGFGNCNNTPGDGCEVDITTSTAHCGACGAACALANATASCVARACAVASCAANFGDCDGSAANGCEAPLLTDAQNCGACGNRCASGVCVAGLCNPFPSTGGEGAFAPSSDIALSPGIHNFTTVSIPVGVRITTTGTGVLDLRATGAVVINGIIDVSGSVGGEQAAALARGVSCVDNGNGSQGGFTGNVRFASTGGDVVPGTGQFGALGGGGTGSPGTDGTSRLGVTYAGRGSTGGGSGGG